MCFLNIWKNNKQTVVHGEGEKEMTVDFRKQTCLLYAKQVADEMRELASELEEGCPMEEDFNAQATIVEEAIEIIKYWIE